MAGKNFYVGQYEFQCLHGMGEPLYDRIVGSGGDNRPCRVYAPVGSHETLLAYLVRRLLENGANTSFVNRIADAAVSVDELVEDPVEAARAVVPIGAPHPKIVAPRDLFAPERANSAGLDLNNEARLAALGQALERSAQADWRAGRPRPRRARSSIRRIGATSSATSPTPTRLRSTRRSHAPPRRGRPGALSSRARAHASWSKRRRASNAKRRNSPG